MKPTLLFLIVFLVILVLSCEKKNTGNQPNAYIIGFNPDKCYCCWGWSIKMGNDTIKADSLPDIDLIGYDIPSPIPVKIELGSKKTDCSTYQGPLNDKDYYEIKTLSLLK